MANNQIALLAQAPVFDTPFESQGKALQLKQLMNADQLHSIDLQTKQQSLADIASNRAAIQADPTGGQGYQDALAKAGNYSGVFTAKKAAIDQAKTKAETDETLGKVTKQKSELIDAKLKQSRTYLDTVTTPDQYLAWHEANHKDPVLGAELMSRGVTAEQARASIVEALKKPGGFEELLQKSRLGIEKFTELNKPAVHTQNLGGTSQLVSTPGLGGAPTVLSSSKITQSPDSVASNATTQRGQNMTAATAAAGQNAPHYDTERGVIINTKTGVAIQPTLDGSPITSGKALTENQGKATALGMRAIQAMETIKGLEQSGFNSLNIPDRISSGLPFDSGRAAMSDKGQQYDNAQRNFISAVLRKESGAAISTSEFENERKKYFPQVGDSADLIAQKAQQRLLAIEGLKAEAGQQGTQTMTMAPIKRTDIPNKNASGWTLHTDAKGNKAYVSPDGKQFQVVK